VAGARELGAAGSGDHSVASVAEVGFGALIAPPYALGGARLVEWLLAAIAALGFVLAAVLARRVVAEPWATAGAALVGLSPPALGHATAVAPALLAGTLLAGAGVCALAVRDRPRLAPAAAGAAMLGVLPWLGTVFVVPGLPVAVALVQWARHGRGRAGATVPVEIIVASLIFWFTLSRGLYGNLELAIVSTASEPSLPDRLPRLVGMWLDRDGGLLRWAPVLALGWWAAWRLWRTRRDGLSRALPGQRDAEAAAGLAVAVCAAQILVAVIGVRGIDGPGFPAETFAPALPAAAALCGWGLRHAPRVGAALGLLTVAGSAWLLLATAAWDTPPDAPWGPLVAAFPRWESGSAGEVLVTAGVGAAALALLFREWRRGRRGVAA
jgi:hypothetical protein